MADEAISSEEVQGVEWSSTSDESVTIQHSLAGPGLCPISLKVSSFLSVRGSVGGRDAVQSRLHLYTMSYVTTNSLSDDRRA